MNKPVRDHVLSAQAGVSLLELLISLIIFGVIVLPLMVVPLRASESTNANSARTILDVEIQRTYTRLQEEVNRAYHFLPIQAAANDTSANAMGFNRNRQLFLAYYNPTTNTELRVGYMWDEILNGGVPYNPRRWRLLRVEIPATADLECFQAVSDPTAYPHNSGNCTVATDNPLWSSANSVTSGDRAYIETVSNRVPMFEYCRNGQCGSTTGDYNIDPFEADSVLITGFDNTNATTRATPYPMHYRYQAAEKDVSAMHFRLASQNVRSDVALAEQEILPFAMVINEWNHPVREQEKNLQKGSSSYNYGIPCDGIVDDAQCSVTTSPGNPVTDLAVNALHFDYKTGRLYLATNSDFSQTNPRFTEYIFRFKPGLTDYEAFYENFPGEGFNNTAPYDSFPVVSHSDDSNFIARQNGVEARMQGINLDNEGNIYVLFDGGDNTITSMLPSHVKQTIVRGVQPSLLDRLISPAAMAAEGKGPCFKVCGLGTCPKPILAKYSNSGRLISYSALASCSTTYSGLIFNPSLPMELQVLLDSKMVTGGGSQLNLLAIPKDQVQRSSSFSYFSAFTPPLNTNDFFSAAYAGLLPSTLTFDPLHQRYIFVFRNTGDNDRTVLYAIPADLSNNDGTPASRARVVTKIFFRQESNWGLNNGSIIAGVNPTAVAYDPLTNTVYMGGQTRHEAVPLSGYTPPTLFQIIPNTRLGVVHNNTIPSS